MARKGFKSLKYRLDLTSPAREPGEPAPRELCLAFRKAGSPSYMRDGRNLALELATRLPSATMRALCLALDDYLSMETRGGISFAELLATKPKDATWNEIDDADQGGTARRKNGKSDTQIALPL